jgi:hypothetical protein
LGGGENGWAQKLLGTKPEATPRASSGPAADAAADLNGLDRRSGQQQQRQGGNAPRAVESAVLDDEEGEEEGSEISRAHAQFGTKIHPARQSLPHENL